MKTKYSIRIILFIFSCILCASCAQIGQVEGGDKDSIPPSWLKSTPPNYSLNFASKKVKLVFNEYLTLEEIQSKFVISPPMKEKPEVKLHGKKVIVKLNDTLQANTTYTLQFADAIVDFTEKNKTDNISYVFSTGVELDSLVVGGHVFDAETLEPQEGIQVQLYIDQSDSIPYKELPNYVAKTDTAGRFLIPNVSDATYKILALGDVNRNFLSDLPSESLAFLDSTIHPTSELYYPNDSVKQPSVLFSPNNLELFLFMEEHRVPFLTDRSWTNKRKVQMVFTRSLDRKLKLELLDSILNQDWYDAEYSAESDTVSLWVTDTSFAHVDTLSVKVNYTSWDSLEQPYLRSDTIRLNFTPPKEIDSIPFISYATNVEKGVLGLKDSVYIVSSEPIAGFAPERIHLYELRDTVVKEKREQSLLRFQRNSMDSLIFWFERALPAQPILSVEGFTSSNWYEAKLDADAKKLSVHIRDTAVSNRDTIPLVLNFSNLYYNNTILYQNKRLAATYSAQRILNGKRLAPEHCVFWLEKWSEFELGLADSVETEWLQNVTKKIENDSLRVDLWVLPEIAKRNNILLEVSTTNQTTSGKDTTVVLQVGFRNKAQKLITYARPDSSFFELQFDLPLVKDPVLTPSNFRSFKVWYEAEYSQNKTRFRAMLLDKKNVAQDSLEVQLTYTYLDSLNEELTKEHNLLFIKGRLDSLVKKAVVPLGLDNRTRKKQTRGGESKKREVDGFEVQSWNAMPITFKQDTVLSRKYWLKANLQPEKKYVLLLDTTAFTNYWGMVNDSARFAFSLKTEKEYGTLILTLENLPANAYLQVMDGKGEKVMKEVGRVENGKMTIPLLEEGDYQLRVFGDGNKNKKWDSGNYLQHRLPEYMRRYLTVFPIKAGWKTEETWDVSDSSVSFGPPTEGKKKKGK